MEVVNDGGDCETDNVSRPEALATLEELEAFRDKTVPNWKAPRKLHLQTIHRYPHLLQPREIDPGHVRALCKAIKTSGTLEPLTVVRADTLNILIDGHHRYEAYDQSGVGHVPVKWFDGTIESAVLEAGRANNRAKLALADGERMQFAWRLTLLRRYSLRQVQEAAGISDGQSRKMRQTLNKLGQNAEISTNWYRALRDPRMHSGGDSNSR